MSHPFKLAKLLGAELLLHESEETVPVHTEQIQQPNTVIGLYFASSAQEKSVKTNEFTERLTEFYKHMQELSSESASASSSSSASSSTISPDDDYQEHAHSKTSNVLSYNFQVIMISFDDSEKRVAPISNDSQNSSPFLIFNNDTKSILLQEHLLRKYNVQESPTLIVLDATSGKVINFDGASKISDDTSVIKKQMEFPWRHPSCSEIISSCHLVRPMQTGAETSLPTSPTAGPVIETVDPRTILDKSKIRGYLFCAYWCPPCRVLVDQLKEVYQRLKDNFDFEVVYISSDRSQDSFDRFLASMPWCGIPFSNEEQRLQLTAALNVRAIPTLVILDSEDNIITTEGRERLNDDLDAIDFPWPAKLIEELHDRHSSILNHYSVCLIYFIGDIEAEYQNVETILQPVATQIAESIVEEALQVKFFIATDSELAESLRLFADMEDSRSYILILDIPNFRYSLTSALRTHDENLVRDLLHKYQTAQLKYCYINSQFV